MQLAEQAFYNFIVSRKTVKSDKVILPREEKAMKLIASKQ
jgi:hypothetical protein